MKLFYRYRNHIDLHNRTCIELETYELNRETACYYMVRLSIDGLMVGKEIRVPKDPKRAKRISHTKQDAWNGFLIRQQRRAMYAELNLKLAKVSIEYIKKNLPPDDNITVIKKNDYLNCEAIDEI